MPTSDFASTSLTMGGGALPVEVLMHRRLVGPQEVKRLNQFRTYPINIRLAAWGLDVVHGGHDQGDYPSSDRQP